MTIDSSGSRTLSGPNKCSNRVESVGESMCNTKVAAAGGGHQVQTIDCMSCVMRVTNQKQPPSLEPNHESSSAVNGRYCTYTRTLYSYYCTLSTDSIVHYENSQSKQLKEQNCSGLLSSINLLL